MAYNLELAEKIRARVQGLPQMEEKKMFGGVGFPLRGNMACGVHGENLIMRFDPGENEELLSRPHTRPFDLSGRPMTGWLLVEPNGWQDEEHRSAWILKGVEYALTLPLKKK